MKKPSPEKLVDELLSEIDPPAPRSVIIDNPELATAIKYFLDQKANGNPAAKHITLTWFYAHKLREKFNGPAGTTTVRRYVRDILKLDWSTGKAL